MYSDPLGRLTDTPCRLVWVHTLPKLWCTNLLTEKARLHMKRGPPGNVVKSYLEIRFCQVSELRNSALLEEPTGRRWKSSVISVQQLVIFNYCCRIMGNSSSLRGANLFRIFFVAISDWRDGGEEPALQRRDSGHPDSGRRTTP